MIKDIEFYLKNKIFSEKFLLKKRLERSIKKNYEKELSILDRYKNKSQDAIDIGVYRGVYSYKLSRIFNHVYAYEPNPLIYPYLIKNLKKIIKNITISDYALSDSNGETILKIPNRSKSIFKDNIEEIFKLGCATIHKNNEIKNFKSFKVKKRKLDEILVSKKKIGFIKIDVEGHEKEVIQGAKNLILNNKPIMLIEIEERHIKIPIFETINYIKNLNYECYFLRDENLIKIHEIKDTDLNNNFLFLPI